MATMAMDMDTKAKLKILIITLVSPAVSFAGELTLTPSVGLDFIHSDNMRIQGDEDGVESTVSQAFISLDAAYTSALTNFSLKSTNTYATYSHDSDLNSDYTDLAANASYALWKGGPQLIASGTVRNAPRNIAQHAYHDIVRADTGEVRSVNYGIAYSVNNGNINLSTQLMRVTSRSQDNIGERDGETLSLTMSNGSAVKSAFWNLQGNFSNLDNAINDAKFYNIAASFGVNTPYIIKPQVTVFKQKANGSINVNRNLASDSVGAGVRIQPSRQLFVELNLNESLSGVDEGEQFVSTSFNWSPSRRTQINFSNDKRFYGDSYAFNLSHGNRRLNTTISYQESLRAFTRENITPTLEGYFFCPISEEPILDDCVIAQETDIDLENFTLTPIVRYDLSENDEFILDKSLNWNSTFTLKRTNIAFAATKTELEFLESERKNIRSNISLNVRRKMSRNLDLTVSHSFSKFDFSSNIDEVQQVDYYRITKLDFSHRFTQDMSSTISFSHLDRKSNRQNSNYQENRVKINFKKAF